MHSKKHLFMALAFTAIITICGGLYTYSSAVDTAASLDLESKSQLDSELTRRLGAEREWVQGQLKYELNAIQIEQRLTNSLLNRLLQSSDIPMPKIDVSGGSGEVRSSVTVEDSYNVKNSNNVIYYPPTKLE